MMLWGCGGRETFIVFCDPWLEEAAQGCLVKYSPSHPEFTYQLKVISSEVIAAHLRFGQAVDIVFSANPDLTSLSRNPKIFADSLILGDERVVRFRRMNALPVSWDNQCLSLAPGGTALRRFSDEWMMNLPTNESSICKVYPETFSLHKEYISRGFVNECLSFSRLQSQVPGMEIISQGPEIKGLYRVICTTSGGSPDQAKRFLDWIKTEKNAGFLVQYGLVP